MNKSKLLQLLAFFLLFSISLNAQILEPVKWMFSGKRISNTEAEVVFKAKIEKTWHLYSQFIDEGGPIPTSFTFDKSNSYQTVGKVAETSKSIKEFDKSFKMDLVFFANEATFKQKIKILTPDKPFSFKGIVTFMCCDDERCLPPSDIDFDIKFDAVKSDQKAVANLEVKDTTTVVVSEDTTNKQAAIDIAKKDTAQLTASKETITLTSETDNKSLWWFFFVSLLAGFAAILTPCVFPMIPMTVTFFMHNNENKRKAKIQAFFYGFSIIAIYTVIGTVVAVTLGANFANWLSTHWIPNVFFFLIFLIFAASFFGMFEITLPSWMVNKTDQRADQGGYTGAFFMAFTLVLVSFSCTGPIVGAILVQSAGGEILKPIVGMFGFSLAFALPFTLFAIFPSWLSSLPKSGGWLNSVKVVLGFIELALGLKFLSIADQTYHWGILDREVYLAFWIVIFTLQGFYLLGKLKFAHDSDLKHVGVPRLALAIVTFTFVIYMIPGMFGAPLKTLSGYLPPQSSHDFDLNAIIRDNVKLAGSGTADLSTLCEKPKYSEFLHLPHGLEGYFDYEQGLACAKKQSKPIFIDFTGHGCVNCREMESNVWSDPRVLKKLKEEFIVIALYVDDKTELPEKEWITSKYDGKVKKTVGKKYADLQISKYNVNAQPYYVLLGSDGNLLTQPRAYNLDVDAFVNFLDKGISEFKNSK